MLVVIVVLHGIWGVHIGEVNDATSIQPRRTGNKATGPHSVLYTTAQKVADLLDIGPQEAVLVS